MDLTDISVRARNRDGIIPAETLPSGRRRKKKTGQNEDHELILSSKKRENVPQRQFRDDQGCYSHHRSRVHGGGGVGNGAGPTWVSTTRTSTQQSCKDRALAESSIVV